MNISTTKIAIALILVLPPIIYFLTPIQQFVDRTYLVNYLPQLGVLAPIIFIFCCALSGAFPLPGNLLTIVGGAVFGLIWGTVWSTIGISLGAVISFLAARSFLRNRTKNRYSKHRMLHSIESTIDKSTFRVVFAARIVPIAPLSILNVLFGLTSVNLGTYTFATIAGILPGRALYSWLGVTGEAIDSQEFLPLLIAIGCIAILSIAPLLIPKQP